MRSKFGRITWGERKSSTRVGICFFNRYIIHCCPFKGWTIQEVFTKKNVKFWHQSITWTTLYISLKSLFRAAGSISPGRTYFTTPPPPTLIPWITFFTRFWERHKGMNGGRSPGHIHVSRTMKDNRAGCSFFICFAVSRRADALPDRRPDVHRPAVLAQLLQGNALITPPPPLLFKTNSRSQYQKVLECNWQGRNRLKLSWKFTWMSTYL